MVLSAEQENNHKYYAFSIFCSWY